MGYRHSSEEILDAAARTAAREGLGGLSFRRVADEAGTSDRMVVYYFPDKARLISAVLGRVGEHLRLLLAPRHEDVPATTRQDFLMGARRVFTDPSNDWVIRLLVEALGMAVAREEPYASMGRALIEEWVDWVGGLLGPSADRGAAAATVATIDGLLILGALLGPEATAAAWDAAIEDARPAGR